MLCKRCNKSKWSKKFRMAKHRSGNSTRRSICMSCENEIRVIYKNRNSVSIDRARALVRKSCNNRRKSVDGWCGRTVSTLRFKSKSKGLPFNLTVDYLKSIFPIDGKCPALKVSFVMGRRDQLNPSVDRNNPKLGYVEGNVSIISRRANWIKNDASSKELELVANWLKSALDRS